METVVIYRMELKLVDNCLVSLAVVQNEVDDVGLRGLDSALEFLLVHCEEYVLHSETIEIARYEALLAECLDDCLVSDLADLAFQFKMLHRNKF